jgi:hypothetical protein
VGLTKFLTLGLAVSLMGLNMARVGVPISPFELGPFLGMAMAGIVMTVILLIHVNAGFHPRIKLNQSGESLE